MKIFRLVLLGMPVAVILLFYIMMSPSFSTFIAFTAFVISIVFIGVSFWMLGWILEKDVGS